MTKLSRKYIDPEDMGLYVNNFWSALTLMSSKGDIKLLVKDLFTHTEYKMLSKRLEIGRLLLQGQDYQTIEKRLRVTPVTISRISNVLAEKGNGLRIAHQKLNQIEEKYQKRQRERTKNLENAFRKKTQRKTLGGALLKLGAQALDKKISEVIKSRSAKKRLELD